MNPWKFRYRGCWPLPSCRSIWHILNPTLSDSTASWVSGDPVPRVYPGIRIVPTTKSPGRLELMMEPTEH